MARGLKDRIVRAATATPFRLALARYALSLGIAAATLIIIPQTPLEGPVGGLIAIPVILICAWYGGVGPALLMPTLVFLSTWLVRAPEQRPVVTFRGAATLGMFSILLAAVGLAGKYRRRIQADARRHATRIEEQSRALALAQIVFRDLEGRISDWNEGAESLFGWTTDEAKGQIIHELLRTTFPQPLAAVRAELLQTGQWHGEVLQRHRDGTELIVATHWILYRDDAGIPSGVAEIHNDVTALRQAEAAVREADHRKDQFIAVLAHELRNPLAPIRSGFDVLRLSPPGALDDATLAEVHRMIQRQIEQMVRLVDDLLDVGRINTGKIELRRDKVLLGEIIRDAIDSTRPHMQAAGHEVEVCMPERSVMMVADRARLAQVLSNLLNNAAKFTPRGGRISLTAKLENECVLLSVRDTGAGIPSEMLSRIFEMFTQIDNSLIRSRGGLGIGLSIVRTIVELHGGTVQAQSDGPDCGSEFIVTLPVLSHDSNAPVRLMSPSASADGELHPRSRPGMPVNDGHGSLFQAR